MRTILKLIGGLLLGGVIGFVAGGLIVVLFTGTTFVDYVHKFFAVDVWEGLGIFLVAIGALLLSLALLIPTHELGHLVCGLLTGYKFVSFRILNYTFVKENDKLRVKKFGVAGTGGQCLLTPPDLPLADIPTGWYNIGGIVANVILLVIVLPLFLLHLNPFVAEGLWIFVLTDFVLILLNGIPMLGNDGYNMMLLRKNLLSKQGLVNQLRANALIQTGLRPKAMPDSLFIMPDHINYKNPLEVSMMLMHVSRLMDRMEYEETLAEMEALYSHKNKIMPIYVKEIACELAFLYLRTGRDEDAQKLLDKELKKYVDSYRKLMSSKERLLIAITLYLDKNRKKAQSLYESLKAKQDSYLLQGEVKSDLALIEDMLNSDPLKPKSYVSEELAGNRGDVS